MPGKFSTLHGSSRPPEPAGGREMEAGMTCRLLLLAAFSLLVIPTFSADLDADGDGEVTVEEFLSHQVQTISA